MDTRKRISWMVIVGFCVGLQATDALAAEEQNNSLQVSGGIAKPAVTTAVHTNPAGMVGATSAFVIQADAPDIWNNGTYRGGAQTGNSNFGISAGVASVAGRGSRALDLYYGAAVGSDWISLGVAGSTGVSDSNTTTLTAGTLIKIKSELTVGVTAVGVDSGVSEWGGGLSYAASSGIDLVFDAAFSDSFARVDFKPGIKLSSGAAALALAYGTGASAQFAQDFSAGLSYQFTSGNVLQVQYNAGGALSKYYAGLAIHF